MVRHDTRAEQFQQQRFTFAVCTSVVGPLAVALLAIQLIAYHDRPQVGQWLVLIEAILLFIALIIGFLGLGGSHKRWIKERLRSELLRREEFLVRARVGPYLRTKPHLLDDRVSARLVVIDSEVNNPLPLIEMREESTNWRDAFEDAKASTALLPDLAANIDLYLKERVASQRKWFAGKSESHWKSNETLELVAKLTLAAALILAVFHCAVLFEDSGKSVVEGAQKSERPWSIEILLPVIAITLPAVGAALAGLQSIFGSERLSRSYQYHATTLEDIEGRLHDILSGLRSQTRDPREANIHFMRIVLEVETILSNELRMWWLVMYPSTPKAAA